MSATSTRTARLTKWLVVVVPALALLVALGPRNSFGSHQPTPRPAPPAQLDTLDAWLASEEAKVPNIKPGSAKGIVWASPERKRTHIALVYIHGFSANRNETAPMADKVAAALGANIYYARLTGHGLPSEAMGEATVQDWLADATEALAIGRTLGDKVIIIGCSTGATLATWLGLQPEGKAISGFVFISPNFGPFDQRGEITNWPWGRHLVLAAQGEYREWQAASPDEALNWTTRYPTRAVFPMMALVKKVRESDLSQVRSPTLMLYSERDSVISPEQVRKAFARFGSAHKTLEPVTYSTSLSQHVLAGAIKAPEATERMANFITGWLHHAPALFPMADR